MEYSLAIHLIGLVFWLGGLLIVSRFMTLCVNGGASTELTGLIRRVWLGYILPGLVLSTLTGLYQFGYKGAGYYMSQGWFHTKLTFVIILIALTVMAGMQVKKVSAGQALSKGKLSMLHGLTALILVLVVFMTMTMR